MKDKIYIYIYIYVYIYIFFKGISTHKFPLVAFFFQYPFEFVKYHISY